MADDYLYDVFISYERDGLTAGWLRDHFLPLFRTWLRMAISDVCKRNAQPVFFDKSQTDPTFSEDLKLGLAGIEPGDDWDESLRKAIRLSRCMVGIWSPPYFESEWCNVEWQSFDLRAVSTERKLIIPGSFYDGRSFPERANKIQRFDLSKFTLFGPALINSRHYEDFQDTVKRMAEKVAYAIRDAPPFSEWPIANSKQDNPPRPPPPPLPLTRF